VIITLVGVAFTVVEPNPLGSNRSLCVRYPSMLRTIVSLACVSASLWAAPASSAPLQPLKPWLVDSAATHCAALRQYGSKEDPTTLILRPDPTGETYDVLISSRRRGPDLAVVRAGSIDFDGKLVVREAMDYQIKGRPFSTYQFRFRSSEIERARTASKAEVWIEGALTTTFALDGMASVFDGLQGCIQQLQTYWGGLTGGAGAGGVPANGDVRSIFSDKDYPPAVAWTGRGGRVQYLLLIDERGGVAACYVIRPSGSASLDSMGCEVIQERAKFTPARNSNGKAVRSMYVTPYVAWVPG
jgi:hypothetical protein